MTAGLVSALVGFTNSFVVVLAGLESLGANPAHASSGLLTVSITMGLCSILVAFWTRMPISVAWSTPGAALLAVTAAVEGGWPAAVGAFLVTGVLILLTGLIAPLGALIASIPPSIAQAMLAGILFQLCLGPILGLVENPLAVAPVILVWLLAIRYSSKAGGHAVNLAAISAALAAGPEAGEDRSKRWIASLTAGIVLVFLGIGAAALGTLVSLAPTGVIAAVAGLALLGTFADSLKAALTEPGEEIPAAVTFITAASGIAILGVSAAFWALIAGLTVRLALGRGSSR